MLDKDTFDTLTDTYPTASWALWSDDFPNNGCVEEDPTAVRDFLAASEQRARMNPSVVFVGLNPRENLLLPSRTSTGSGSRLGMEYTGKMIGG